MPKHVSIKDRLTVFAGWWKNDTAWFTTKQLAATLNCRPSSVDAALGWLRRNGFTVTKRWDWEEKANYLNIRRGVMVKQRHTLKELRGYGRDLRREAA